MGDLLIVDDEDLLAQSYARFFSRAGHEVRQAATGAAALAAFRTRRPDVVLLDVNLPDMTGFDVFDALRDEHPVVVMISGHAEIPMAVRAVQAGAETLLTKPVDLAHLGLTIDRALERGRLQELSRLLNVRRRSAGLVALGTSPDMQELQGHVELLASADRTPVLLLGEPGTGKARLAELIHALSPRHAAPFTAAHCGTTSTQALDTDLFGREGDAGRPGLLEVANGGTLLLDQVGDLPASLQPRLLQVLDGRAIRRVAGTREIPVDVRLIAATSRDLIAEVNAGQFREDLYYRLAVMPLRLPPLRERAREDVVALIARLSTELASGFPRGPRQVSDEAVERLLEHPWPGNMRELRNVLERAMLLSQGRDSIDATALPRDLGSRDAGEEVTAPLQLVAVERAHIARALQWYGDNRSHAARALGISRATLIKKIRLYGLGARPASAIRGRRT